jgi:hypothetical protein
MRPKGHEKTAKTEKDTMRKPRKEKYQKMTPK